MAIVRRFQELTNQNNNDHYSLVYNKIINNQRNEIYYYIEDELYNVNKNLQYCGINYFVYYIFNCLIKTNNYHQDFQFIDTLVNEGYITYLTDGNIKLITNELNNLSNDNSDVLATLVNILNILTNEQLFIILNANYGYSNNNQNGNNYYYHQNLTNKGSTLYNLESINGDDYIYKHYNGVDNPEKDYTINHLENNYNTQNKKDYFSYAITKLYNSNNGIIHNNNLMISNDQLKFLLYYIDFPGMDINDKFIKFCRVLTNEQLIYIGV